MQHDLFELTFEKAAVGIAHLDATGKWIRANPYLCNFLGYTPEELFALTFQEITYVEDLEYDLSHARKILDGTLDSFSIEKRYVRKDGTPTWAHLRASAIRDHEGKVEYFISVISDINERKQLEIELETAHATTQKYLDNVDVMVMVVDQHNVVQMINRRGCEILGYEAAEIIGKNWIENFLPERLRSEIVEIEDQLRHADPSAYVHENEIITKCGSEKIISWHNTPLFNKEGEFEGVLCSGEDVTEIRKAQHKLIESEQFYRTIVSSIDKAIFILENNRIVDCNDAALALFEVSEDEIIGSHVLQSTHALECKNESFETHLIHAYSGKKIKDQCTLVLKNDVKTSKVLELTLAHYGSNTDKLIMLAKDITQKLEEEKFFKMHSRQAQMGEMISMIAHQWRQPLAIINAIASQLRIKEMLQEKENDDLIQNLIKIEQQSIHLSQTISDYRDFFRPDKPLEMISLSDLTRHTLDLIDHVIKSKGVTVLENIRFHTVVPIYRNEVIQVLITLMKNSLDAFEENEIENPQITITITQENDEGIIELHDNGGGIPTEMMNKMFIPYFTTKNHAYGTGLGLYMSKTIIEEHCGGILEIMSENRFTTVRIKFPMLNPVS